MDKDGMEVRKGYDGNAARTPFPLRACGACGPAPPYQGGQLFFFLLLFSPCVLCGSGLKARKE